MQNFSLTEAKERSANFIKNAFNPNTYKDYFISLLQMFGAVFIHSQNNELLQAIRKTNVNNMIDIELDNEGEKYNVIRQQATQSEGIVVFNITNLLAQIDIGTSFIVNNNIYNATTTTVGQELILGNATKNLLIKKIETFASTKIVIVYCENHGLSKGIQVVGSGFGIAGLNGLQTIIGFDKNSFRFVNEAVSTTTSLTSLLDVEFFTTNIIKTNIRSAEVGAITNVSRGSEVQLSNALQYIGSAGFVDYNEIGIGADRETDDNYRKRIVEKKQTPGNIADIKTLIFNQSGVTRVGLVEKDPFIGNFTIYFLRDNDSDIIPTQQELDAVKNILISDKNISPRITADYIFVKAPTEVKRHFIITSLMPNTKIMQEAIKAQLKEIVYNIGIQDRKVAEITAIQLRTLLVQSTQDSAGNVITNLSEIAIKDTINQDATLKLNVGEFVTVEEVNFS